MAKQVPVISLLQPEEAAAKAVRQACVEFGFFTITDHGVPADLVAAALRENERLFALPLEKKLNYKLNADFRGYAPIGAEALDLKAKTSGDSKEGMYYGAEYPPGTPGADQPLMGHNIWPEEQLLPGHKRVMQAYLGAMVDLGNRLNRLLALAIGLPADAFDRHFSHPRAGIRLLRYAPVASKPEAGQFGAGAHTDYGDLTVLLMEGGEAGRGLQIFLEGQWVDVQPAAGDFVVNLGDMLERWTNGLFRSTLHRVLTRAGQQRRSIAFFYDPASATRIEPFEQCCPPGTPPRFAPISAGEHLLSKLTTTYASQGAAPLQIQA